MAKKPSITKAIFPVQKCRSGALIPASGTHEVKSPRLVSVYTYCPVWSHRVPDSSSYRHMTPAKRTSLGSSSKLLSDCNHSFPAIVATDAHNDLIVATENVNSVRSWRRLSFSVISQRILLLKSNLALPGDVTADDENPVFVNLIIDIPAADSEMLHNKRNKYFYCVVFTAFALPVAMHDG